MIIVLCATSGHTEDRPRESTRARVRVTNMSGYDTHRSDRLVVLAAELLSQQTRIRSPVVRSETEVDAGQTSISMSQVLCAHQQLTAGSYKI